MSTERWFKANIYWVPEWLIDASDGARLAWIQLIAYAKASGSGGRVKAMSPRAFARAWFLSSDAVVSEMLTLAIADGAIEEDEDQWVLTGWAKHQGDETAANRMVRYRERKKKGDAVTEPVTEDDTVTPVTRNDRNVTLVTEIRREEKRLEENTTPLPPTGESQWWDGDEAPVGKLAQRIASIKLQSGKPGFDPSDIRKVPLANLLERVSKIDPGKEFASVLDAFEEYHGKQRKAPYKLPHSALGDWVTKREADWLRLKAARERNVITLPSSKLMSADEAARLAQ